MSLITEMSLKVDATAHRGPSGIAGYLHGLLERISRAAEVCIRVDSAAIFRPTMKLLFPITRGRIAFSEQMCVSSWKRRHTRLRGSGSRSFCN